MLVVPCSVGYVLELQQFAKNGVPPSLRSAIWSQILRLDSPTVQRSADLVQRDDTDAAPLPCKEERHFGMQTPRTIKI
eukprot:SAG31_NODE_695_length_12765_cov_6.974499_4_plen_78_part_00